MRTKPARFLCCVSLCLLLAASLAPAGEADRYANEARSLAAIEQKSADQMIRLALLSRKLHDEPAFERWMNAAAAAAPERTFTSERSPFVYVLTWSLPLTDNPAYTCVRGCRDFFYAIASQVKTIGADRLDPQAQEVAPVRITEVKADFSAALAPEYSGRFWLANNGITFGFEANGEYIGQIVTMDRHKLLGADTLHCALDCGDFYMSDRFRFIGRINRHGDRTREISLKTGRSGTIAGMDADKDENLYVAISGENTVLILRPDLTERCRIGGVGSGPGMGISPVDIGVCGSAVALADSVLRKVQVLDKNGAWLMNIPSFPHAVAIDERGTILAMEQARFACYTRLFKQGLRNEDGPFPDYLHAIELMENGKLKEARDLLKPLATGLDRNLAQVAASLLENDTLALTRHYAKPRPLSLQEAASVAGRPIEAIFHDPIGRCTWATIRDNFLVRIDEFERVTDFGVFPALHGLAGKLSVSRMRFDEDWCYAVTNHGTCRYSRADGDWQLRPWDDKKPE